MWEVSLVIVEFAGKVNYQGGYSKTLSVWAKPLSRAPFASSRGLSLNADAPHMVFPPVPDREDVLGKKRPCTDWAPSFNTRDTRQNQTTVSNSPLRKTPRVTEDMLYIT